MPRLLPLAAVLAASAGCGSRSPEPTPAPAASASAPAPALDAGDQGAPIVSVESRTLRPEQVEPTDERVAGLTVPPGFAVSVFARDLEGPRMMAAGPDGTVYLTQPKAGNVIALRDDDGDGRADSRRVVVSERPDVHGIAIRGDRIYLAQPTTILRGTLRNGQVADLRPFATGLPDGGQHPNRTLGFDPEGRLHISIGSSCNACAESNPEHATLLRLSADGSTRTIVARGLRDTIGFDWHPGTGELWGMDHGSDHRGDDIPPEELNRIEEGGDYGWPYVYGKGEPDPIEEVPDDTTIEELVARSVPAVMTYAAHSAPIEMIFYDAELFPEEMRGDAFVALHGSWNRVPPVGYEVVRIRFEGGAPVAFEPFLSGFLIDDGQRHFGRPAGLLVAGDGSLLVGDDAAGVVYRVAPSRVARR